VSDKELADIVCRALFGIIAAIGDNNMPSRKRADVVALHLLAIVSAIRKKYDIPAYKNITVEIKEGDTIATAVDYKS